LLVGSLDCLDERRPVYVLWDRSADRKPDVLTVVEGWQRSKPVRFCLDEMTNETTNRDLVDSRSEKHDAGVDGDGVPCLWWLIHQVGQRVLDLLVIQTAVSSASI